MKTIGTVMILSLVMAFGCGSGSAQEISRLSTQEFSQVIKEKAIQLIDVRTPEEVSFGMIPGAVNIDFYDTEFLEKCEALDKDAPIAVYCAAGGRSSSVATKLQSMGFKKIYDLKNGYRDWVAQGYPVSK